MNEAIISSNQIVSQKRKPIILRALECASWMKNQCSKLSLYDKEVIV